MTASRPLPFFALAASVLGLDLWSKAWASRALAEGPRSLLPGRVNLVLAHNPHGAMGFLHAAPGEVRRIVLVAAAVVASVVVVALARTAERRSTRVGLALVLGGALGNLIDRLFSGAVVDFIDVVLTRTRHWHTFNVADVAIVAGVALLMLDAMKRPALR